MFRNKFVSTMLVAIFAIGITATTVNAQTRTRRMPGTSAAAPKAADAKPADTTEKPKVETPATKAVALTIEADVPTTMEVGRKYEFAITITGGKADYNITETPDEIPCVISDVQPRCSPTKTGSFELVIKVSDSSEPKNEASKTVKINVVPHVTKLEDLEDAINELKNKTTGTNQLDLNQNVPGPNKITTGEALQALWGGSARTAQVQNDTQTLRYRVERANKKLNWVIYGGIGLILVFIANLAVALIGRQRQPRREVVEGRATITRSLILILGLGLLGANIASAQEASKFEPSRVVAGSKNVAFKLTGKDLDQVSSLKFNDEFKVKTRKDATGADVQDLKVNKTSITGTFTSIDANTEGGVNGFILVKQDGSEVAADAGFYVIDSDLAAYIQGLVNEAREDHKRANYATEAYVQQRIQDLPTTAQVAKVVDNRLDDRMTEVNGRVATLEQMMNDEQAANSAANTATTQRVGNLEQHVEYMAAAGEHLAGKKNFLTRKESDSASKQIFAEIMANIRAERERRNANAPANRQQ